MPRNERHVVPNQNGGWDVRAPDASRVSAHLEQQEEAVDRARQILRNKGGGELVIHDRQGGIREKDTVGPAPDPLPPKG